MLIQPKQPLQGAAKEEFEKFKENLNNQILISSSGFSCATLNQTPAPSIPGDPKGPNNPQITIIGNIQSKERFGILETVGINPEDSFFNNIVPGLTRGPYGQTPPSDEEGALHPSSTT